MGAKQAAQRLIAGRLTAGRKRQVRLAFNNLRTGMGPRVSAAIVGCGQIASLHQESWRASGLARVTAVSDISSAALSAALEVWPWVNAYRDVELLLAEEKPDVISICTWPDSHAELVELAAAAGVSGILCEKPLALSMSQIRRATEAAQKAGVKLAGGHQYRFHPNFVAAAELIRDGVIGTPLRLEGYIAGALADNGPHLVDSARFLVGDPRVLQTDCEMIGDGQTVYQGAPVEIEAGGTIIFESDGRELPLEFSSGTRSPGIFGITVEGDGGTLEVSRDRLSLDGEPHPQGSEPSLISYHSRQFREFVEWTSGKREDYPARDEVTALAAETVVALYESAASGAAVELPLAPDCDPLRRDAVSDRGPAGSAAKRPSRNGSVEPLAIEGGPQAVREWFSCDPVMGKREVQALSRVISSRCLNRNCGPETPALEAEFARAYGVDRAVASTSGTSALHLALGALNPQPGDEVITSPVTDIGSVIPILRENCVPVFADVNPATGNMTVESIAEKITPRTRAVVLVHLFGHPADVVGVKELLDENDIALIEDCCQAHLAEVGGRMVGTFGDFGCLSLQQSKQITCGDGGITLVNRPELVERTVAFADKGTAIGAGHCYPGMNYRMTELQAAVARVQLDRLPELMGRRRQMAELLSDKLSAIDGVISPTRSADETPSWWVFSFRIDEEKMGVSTDEFADALRVEGVRLIRPYLRCPVFGHDQVTGARVYGETGRAFCEVEYDPPCSDDYPGYAEFERSQMGIFWSARISERHVGEIAGAVEKVAAAQKAIK